MRLKHLLATLMLLFSMAMVAQEMQMPPIPIDANVRIGKLPNGLTYYIRHNNWPEKRVNFYIAQRVGSIQEEESQRGLAHFLEHMAFNGTEHFPGNGVIDYTRSLGVEFGGDLNAYTSIDQTVYRICDVPSTRQSALDSCLLILRDWSCGLLLEGDEIDKERGVIHEEWRLRSGASSRMFERNLPTLYPGSKYGVRFPIGLMSVVDNFKYNEIRDYYHKWYRPDNQGIIVVGDIDVDYTEAKIKEMFGPIVLAENAAPVVDEPVPDNEQMIIVVDKDKEQTNSIVEVMFKHDATTPDEKFNLDYLIQQYAIEMAVNMLNHRLDEKAQEPDCPFTAAGAEDDNYIYAKTKDCFSLFALPKDGKTAEALQTIIEETLRATNFGFTSSEYERARTEFLSQKEKQFNNRNQTTNSHYGDAYRDHFLANEPIPSIEEEYQIWNTIAPYIPIEAINMLLPELIPSTDTNVVVLNFNPDREGFTLPLDEDLKNAVYAARSAELTPYVDNVKDEPLMSELPAKGQIVSEKVNDQFGYKELTLSNGATVIIKKTDFKDDEIKFSAQSKGGASLYDESDYANIELFDDVIENSGLGEFDNTELKKALSGKQVGLEMELSTSYERLQGNSSKKDLETLFQLNYLMFTNIKKDDKGFQRLINLMETQLKNRDVVPEVAFSDSLQYTVGNHSWRNRPFLLDDLKQVNYDRILQIAKERTANAADFTFYFVGSFDEDVLKGYIEQYIASLPANAAKENFRDVTEMPTGDVVNRFTRKMETPKAISYMVWHTSALSYNLENALTARLAGSVLDMTYNKKIREDASAAYSTAAYGYIQNVGNKVQTQILGYCPLQPEKAELAMQIMKEEMAAMAISINDDYLIKSKEQLIKDHQTQLKDNNYWLRELVTLNTFGIDMITGYEDILNRISAQDISKFVKDVILSTNNRVEVTMLPEE